MCLNGWGGKLHKEILLYLSEEIPDVLCLQEVVHSPETNKNWLTYRDGDHILPQRANFFRDVKGCLPDHFAVFCPAAQGVLWDKDIAVPSQWGLATFVHKAFPTIGQIQSFVHKSYTHDGFGEHPRSRCAHAIRVFNKESARPVTITQMHGLRDLRGKMDTPERAMQAQRFLEISRQISQPGDLSILCGDFNVEPDSETLQNLADAGFTELVTGRGFTSTRSSHYTKPVKYADYMLVNDEGAVKAFDVIYNPEVSDHCPLVLTL
jgi:endonuclease/exonuclease/phosphatase family metal-dependent hydrolase